MQTFLPYPDFSASARVLDYRRAGKQRVEAFQILKALYDSNYGWQNHPAVKMWRGYEEALKVYFNAVSLEWVKRGYQHTMGFFEVESYELPVWFGNEDFHYSHRSNLYYKNPVYYFGWTGVAKVDYVWPI